MEQKASHVGLEPRNDNPRILRHDPDDCHECAQVCLLSRRGCKRHAAVSKQSRHGADVSQSESSELHLTFVLAFAYLAD